MTLLSRRAMLTLPAVAVPRRKKRRCKVGMQPDQSGVFFQLIIVGGGEFTYDAAGNLRTANVGQTTTDPIQGITCYAGFSTFNGFGAIISLFSSTLDAQLWYADTGSSSQGALTNSSASATGTDPFGNAYLTGEASYSPSTGQATAVNQGALQGYFGPVGGGGPWTLSLDMVTAATSGGGTTIQQIGGPLFLRAPTAKPVTVGGAGPFTAAKLEVQGSLAVGAALSNIREWYAPSGGDDFAALNTALSSYGSADLLPGTYELSAQLNIAGACLQGCDMATVIQPFGAYAGVLVSMGGQSSMRNLSLQNSGTDAVRVASGIAEWWLEDLFFASNAGFCINANSVTAPTHGRIRGIRGSGGGSANGGGIAINGGTGAAITAEVNIYDIDIQNCTTSEVLFLSAVTDVLAFEVNGGIKGGVAANGVTVQGSCQTCALSNFDIGGGSGTGVMVLKAAGGNSPTDIYVQGKLQGGTRGLVVNDGTARSRFIVDCTRNQLDGAQFNATNTGGNKILGMFNLNNQSAGTAYDINVTNTGHLFIDAPQYATPGGGAVTANAFFAVGNNATHQFPPAGSTVAGAAPGGW